MSEQSPGTDVPQAVRLAALVLAVEAVGLIGITLFLLYSTVTGRPSAVARALLDAAIAAGGAVALLFGARALLRLRPAARTPMVVIQILAIPVAYSLGFQAGRIAIGGPILLAALGVLYLLFTPPARAALERDTTV